MSFTIKLGEPNIRWTTDSAQIRWIMAFSTLTINHLSTEYYLLPVSATKAGTAYNPTSDIVQFAFMPTPTQVPQTSDWQTGSWETVPTNILYPYNARCLIGTAGTITLTQGTYTVYVKITDSPEIPVQPTGQLVIS